MDLWAAPTMDTRVQFRSEREDLLALIDELPPAQWTAPTPAQGWTVKDVALHLLDGDLGRLSRDRDGDVTGLLPVSDDLGRFAAALAAKNQRWLEATRKLSPRVIRDMFVSSTLQVQEWTTGADLRAATRVSWASNEPVPTWLDLARELTETWVHHQQIRAAVARDTSTRRLPEVLRTFVWAFPHQYRVPATRGTTVEIDLDTGGQWHLVTDTPQAGEPVVWLAGSWRPSAGPRNSRRMRMADTRQHLRQLALLLHWCRGCFSRSQAGHGGRRLSTVGCSSPVDLRREHRHVGHDQ
jgi:uncharacterized protein (TIGR03083 family)